MLNSSFLELLLALVLGLFLGTLSFFIFHRIKKGSYETIGTTILQKAEFDAKAIRQNGEVLLKQQQMERQKELEIVWQAERKKLLKEEEQLKIKEDKIDARMHTAEKKLHELEKKESFLSLKTQQLEEEKKNAEVARERFMSELEKISGLSQREAKEVLMDKTAHEAKSEAANLTRKIIKEAEDEGERKAKAIIVGAINRLSVPCVSETTVHTVSIPSEEMKGRIIGKEGRNIRTLEKETGVNFIIDDTPMAVVLSGFDPIRIHIAKLALTELVTDGRIHPTRIEEAVLKARETAIKEIKQYGEDAALKAGAMNLHPQIITLLGKLKFRFSYGQNILDHSLEVSHLMGLMAAECRLDVRLAKRIGLLHDMGKAVSHEMEGTHAIIGHDLALRYGESEKVANGIGCHHQEMEPITLEAAFCSGADAISGARPGARIEAVEEYLNRLKRLEEIALEFPGVDKAFALQAGREVRISVLPDLIDDQGVMFLAKDLTKRIEQELNYPGKIKVTVVREKRAVEYAI
ncbi:MAG TPA: ribonuclease Y [Parachlamydiaceae bacterium]|nr:ribonuclease Y [Parachlamydiaceae bacterium]